MATNNNVCYYGQHIGCPNAHDPNCRTCAEHLTHAVNYVALEANSTSTDVAEYPPASREICCGVNPHYVAELTHGRSHA